MNKKVIGGIAAAGVAVAVGAGGYFVMQNNGGAPTIDEPMETMLQASYQGHLDKCMEEGGGEGTADPANCQAQATDKAYMELLSGVSEEKQQEIRTRANEIDAEWAEQDAQKTMQEESTNCFREAYPEQGDNPQDVIEKKAAGFVNAPDGMTYTEYVEAEGDQAKQLTPEQTTEVQNLQQEAQTKWESCFESYAEVSREHQLDRDRQLVKEFPELADAVKNYSNNKES